MGPIAVIDTPVAESGIVGAAFGMAVAGMRPIAEMQFMGFSYPAVDQIINHVSRIRNRSRHRFTAPLVIRIPYGAGIGAAEHHSESAEAMYVHTPGLKVVVPGSPYDAKGLLLAAVEDPDPVIFLEPIRIYRALREEVPDEAYVVPIGEASIERRGTDVSLISYGAMLRETRRAADALEAEGVSVEVVDVRSLSPFDAETVVGSAAGHRTGRGHTRGAPNRRLRRRDRRPDPGACSVLVAGSGAAGHRMGHHRPAAQGRASLRAVGGSHRGRGTAHPGGVSDGQTSFFFPTSERASPRPSSSSGMFRSVRRSASMHRSSRSRPTRPSSISLRHMPECCCTRVPPLATRSTWRRCSLWWGRRERTGNRRTRTRAVRPPRPSWGDSPNRPKPWCGVQAIGRRCCRAYGAWPKTAESTSTRSVAPVPAAGSPRPTSRPRPPAEARPGAPE